MRVTGGDAKNARLRGLRVIIAGAGLSAALPGVVAAHTELPVIGVPLTSSKSIAGGLLLQTRDNGQVPDDGLAVVTKRAPSSQELADCRFAWTVARVRFTGFIGTVV